MSFTYLERQELNAMSKEVYGKSSFWYNHLYKRGVVDRQTKKLTIFHPAEELKAYMLATQERTAKMLEELKVSAANGNSK